MAFPFEPLRARPDVCLRTPQVLKPIPRKPRFPQAGLSLSDARIPLAEQRKARAHFLPTEKPAGVVGALTSYRPGRCGRCCPDASVRVRVSEPLGNPFDCAT